MIITLILLFITAMPSLAAPTSTSGSWIDASSFTNLSSALASPSTVGKTVVVSTPMAINNTTTDRTIDVSADGKIIIASGKTFTYNGSTAHWPVAQIVRVADAAGKYMGEVGFNPATAGKLVLGHTTTARPDWWVANTKPGVTDMTDAIVAATTAIASGYEAGKEVVYSGTVYRITHTMNFNLTTASSVHWRAEGKATIFCDQPDGQWAMDIDFATAATANFVSFNMTNIAFSDLKARLTKKGVHASRLIASNWIGCEFNYLSDATDFGGDSNLNHLDTCSWRGNVRGWHSSKGVANNNVFTNCQWRYNKGISFDSTGTSGNMIIGGDFEPYNASPVVISHSLTMDNVRVERNAQNVIIRDLGDSRLIVSIYSDGGTQALPAVEFQGSDTEAWVTGSAATLVHCTATSSRNTIHLGQFTPLVDYTYVTDFGTNNAFYTGSSIQSADGLIEAGLGDRLVPPDITTWTKTGCTVTAESGGYKVVATAPSATITYTLTGRYSGIALASTIRALNSSGIVGFIVNGVARGAVVTPWPGGAARSVSVTSNQILTNPTIGYYMPSGRLGSAFFIKDVRSASGGVFPE